jgi:hypothetical protein
MSIRLGVSVQLGPELAYVMGLALGRWKILR